MGIPLLYPWANRLAQRALLGGGPRRRPRLRRPAAEPGSQRAADPRPARRRRAAGRWSGTRPWATGLCSRRSFDFGAHDELMAAFPFPHELLLEATLAGTTLTIATTVRASGDASVPVSFGYHPYLRLPGVDRSDWEIELPVRERLRLDRLCSPPASARPSACRGAGWARGRSTTRLSVRRRAPAPSFSPAGADGSSSRSKPAIRTRRCTRRTMTR